MKRIFLHIICLFLLFACSQQDASMVKEESSLAPEMDKEIVEYYQYPWVEAIAKGGTKNYTYEWKEESKSGLATNGDIAEGSYSVVVTDVNGNTIRLDDSSIGGLDYSIDEKTDMDVSSEIWQENISSLEENKLANTKKDDVSIDPLQLYARQKIEEVFDLAELYKNEENNQDMRNLSLSVLSDYFGNDKEAVNDFLKIDKSKITRLYISLAPEGQQNVNPGILVVQEQDALLEINFIVSQREIDAGKMLEFKIGL